MGIEDNLNMPAEDEAVVAPPVTTHEVSVGQVRESSKVYSLNYHFES
jgi:hypothetical protein